jgi:hypothetical protein
VEDEEETVADCNGTYNIFGVCVEDEEVEAPTAETTEPELIESDNTSATTGTTDDGNAEVGVDLTGLSNDTLESLGDIEDVEITVEIDGGDLEYEQVSCSGSIDIFGNCLTSTASTSTGTTSGSSSTGSSNVSSGCSEYDIFGNCVEDSSSSSGSSSSSSTAAAEEEEEEECAGSLDIFGNC